MPRKPVYNIGTITPEEVEVGLRLFYGEPVIAIEPSHEILIRDGQGGTRVVNSPVWIKLSTGMRPYLKTLKGALLPIYLCICLHVGDDGTSFPSYAAISETTSYSRSTVIRSIRKLEKMPGLLDIIKRPHKSNIYRPNLAAFGSSNPKI